MRAKVAKKIRRAIYGDLSTKVKKYHWWNSKRRTIVRDKLRRAYQMTKRAFNATPRKTGGAKRTAYGR